MTSGFGQHCSSCYGSFGGFILAAKQTAMQKKWWSPDMLQRIDDSGRYSCDGCSKMDECRIYSFQLEKLRRGETSQSQFQEWKNEPCREWMSK